MYYLNLVCIKKSHSRTFAQITPSGIMQCIDICLSGRPSKHLAKVSPLLSAKTLVCALCVYTIFQSNYQGPNAELAAMLEMMLKSLLVPFVSLCFCAEQLLRPRRRARCHAGD